MDIDFNRTWDELKRINSYKVISSMYIWIFVVPILIKTFELVNEKFYNFVIFGQVIQIQLELPFSLTLFYFSAILFALGNLLLTARCPLIIRENDSLSDFQNEGKKLQQLKPYIEDIKFNWEKLAKEVEAKIERQYNAYRTLEPGNRNIDNMLEKDIQKEDLRNYFWEIYGTAKESRAKSRFFTTTFYALGFLLMSIVLIQNFSFIVSILYKQNF